MKGKWNGEKVKVDALTINEKKLDTKTPRDTQAGDNADAYALEMVSSG